MVQISMNVLGEILGRMCSVRLGLWAHPYKLSYLVLILCMYNFSACHGYNILLTYSVDVDVRTLVLSITVVCRIDTSIVLALVNLGTFIHDRNRPFLKLNKKSRKPRS